MSKKASVEDEEYERSLSECASQEEGTIYLEFQEEGTICFETQEEGTICFETQEEGTICFETQEIDCIQVYEFQEMDSIQAIEISKQPEENLLQAMEKLNQAHAQAQKALARTIEIAPGPHRSVNSKATAVPKNQREEVAQTILHNVRQLIDRTPPEELSKQFASLIDDNLEIDDSESESLLSLELENLKLLYSRRQELLKNTITSTQVAELLGWNSRKTVHDRLKAKDIIGIKDKSHLRFPIWQFDPDGDNGILDGLPELLSALEISDFRKLSWLTKPLRTFEDRTPVEILKRGNRPEIEELIVEAEGVGVLQ